MYSIEDVSKWLRERVKTCWRIGNDNLAEWHEYKRDEFIEFADLCERESTKAFRELSEDSSKKS